jgi:hypothetical protein
MSLANRLEMKSRQNYGTDVTDNGAPWKNVQLMTQKCNSLLGRNKRNMIEKEKEERNMKRIKRTGSK